ncbi:hypothetical protein FACS1894139_18410 [Planctomycetales bacterium]|nr:hypothetical protein FACS1894108_15120 [Planctomycetales bacterium]GHT08576.1 hypothetical protein FACS1894139_18410 [Planctomycetales bacterium]
MIFNSNFRSSRCPHCQLAATPTPPTRADILWQKFTIGFFKLAAAATVIYYAVAVA